MAPKKKKRHKDNHEVVLRIGFAIFLAIWGLDRFFRADMWASPDMMGSFYGGLGTMVGFIKGLGVAQILIALSFLFDYKVKLTSIVLLAMLVVSTVVTIMPLINYLMMGGNPIPAIIFADHFPLLAGAWAIFAHAKKD